MKKEKILITTGIYPPEIGGPATYTALIEKELPKYGIEVEVLPFRIVRKFPKLVRHFVFLCKVLAQGRNKDILYSQDPVSCGFPTMIAAKLLRKPFLIRIAGDYAWEQATQNCSVKESIEDFQNKNYGFKVELTRFLQKMTARMANKIITPSKYFCSLVSKWNPKTKNVMTIYNGIDFSDIQKSNEVFESKTMISAGRLVNLKGFGGLITIMKDLPEWKLFIAGDGPEREKLAETIKGLKLENRVFMLGNLSRPDLINKMRQCEVFALLSFSESFSFVTVEAMRIGVPVIATNVGSLPEIIENGKEGLLVKPGSKEDFQKALAKLEDLNFRAMLIDNAFNKSEMFSINETSSRTAEVVRNLANHK